MCRATRSESLSAPRSLFLSATQQLPREQKLSRSDRRRRVFSGELHEFSFRSIFFFPQIKRTVYSFTRRRIRHPRLLHLSLRSSIFLTVHSPSFSRISPFDSPSFLSIRFCLRHPRLCASPSLVLFFFRRRRKRVRARARSLAVFPSRSASYSASSASVQSRGTRPRWVLAFARSPLRSGKRRARIRNPSSCRR